MSGALHQGRCQYPALDVLVGSALHCQSQSPCTVDRHPWLKAYQHAKQLHCGCDLERELVAVVVYHQAAQQGGARPAKVGDSLQAVPLGPVLLQAQSTMQDTPEPI